MTQLKFYFSALVKSFYSRDFYFNLIWRNNFYGFKYIFLLALLLAIPVSFQVKQMLSSMMVNEAGLFHAVSGSEINKEIDNISAQLPNITFEDNRFISDSTAPSYIKGGDGSLVAVIDTERKLTNLSNFNNLVLLRENEMILIMDGRVSGSVPAADLYQSFRNYFTVNDEGKPQFNIKAFFRDFYSIVTTPYPVIFVFCIIWFAIKYFFKALLYSFISGLFLGLMLKNYQFDFKLCLRIAIFTATPVALLEFVTYMIGYNIFNYGNLVYFLTHMIYIYFAVESYKKISSRIAHKK